MDTLYDFSMRQCLLGFNSCLIFAIQCCVSVSELADNDSKGFLSFADDIANAYCFVLERMRYRIAFDGITIQLLFSLCFAEALPPQLSLVSNCTCKPRSDPNFLTEHHNRFQTFGNTKVLFLTFCAINLFPIDFIYRKPQISVLVVSIFCKDIKEQEDTLHEENAQNLRTFEKCKKKTLRHIGPSF